MPAVAGRWLQPTHTRSLGRPRLPGSGAQPAARSRGSGLKPRGANGATAAEAGGGTAQAPRTLRDRYEVAYLSLRSALVCQRFPQALGMDDFLNRVEVALFAYGFTGDNSIAMVNLCRDEITNTLKHKIDSVFGSAFNVNGLGGVLTCGTTGVAAGLSHAPVSGSSGKERYVFWSFPHISIDARGQPGTITRPGRPGASCACGALQAALVDIRRDGLASSCRIPGVHDARNPEFSILKQRLARRLRFEGAGEHTVQGLDLVGITRVAERTITDDLELLISQTVDPARADYAVVTGVQIHSWGSSLDADDISLEFVAPSILYAVVNGEKTFLDLSSIPSLSPRQIRLLAQAGDAGGAGDRAAGDIVCNSGGSSTLLEVALSHLPNSKEQRRRGRDPAHTYAGLLDKGVLHPQALCRWPSWQSHLRAGEPQRDAHDTSVVIDRQFESDDNLEAVLAQMQTRYTLQDDAPPAAGSAGNSAAPASPSNYGSGAQLPRKAGVLRRLLKRYQNGGERPRQQEQE